MQRKLLWSLLFSLLPLALFSLPAPARTGTVITVNSPNDILNFSDGKCTLREAIIVANTDASLGTATGECAAGSGADTIVLPAGVYTLTRPSTGVPEIEPYYGDLDITQTLTIQGHSPDDTIIHQSVADRVLEIFSPATVVLTNLAIDGGNDTICAGGGGIFNHGNVILMNVKFTSNYSCAGGGLLNGYHASADLSAVSFISNTGVYTGGAIYNIGTLTLTRSLLSFDHANVGAGIANELLGSTTIISSVIMAETANFGGGIYNLNLLTVTDSSINSNYAYGGIGGGILNETNLILSNNATLWLTNVTLSTNLALSDTLAAGGGLYTSGDVTLTNVTVANNFATTSGGGILLFTAIPPGSAHVRNSIFSNNTSAMDGNCNASLTSLGYNIDSGNSCGLTATGDMTTTNPLIGSLADNGGGTYTHALLPGSPAINKIPIGLNTCPHTDQRGYARVGPCDIGAFEYVVRLLLPLIQR